MIFYLKSYFVITDLEVVLLLENLRQLIGPTMM